MEVFICKNDKLAGRSYNEVQQQARRIYADIAKRTKSNAYVRSAFFQGDKIFLKPFWEHVMQKTMHDRKRRLKLYDCALELLRNSRCMPTVRLNPNGDTQIVYRFYGVTLRGVAFCVHVKQNKKTGNKYFMSVFPL